MRKSMAVVVVAAAFAGCAASDKVLQDFGIKDRPEGYVSGSDKVMARLPDIARTEMDRLNREYDTGVIKFDAEDPLHGRYYKEVRRYEEFRPLDANATTRSTADTQGGYVGYIEYEYQYYESPRAESRQEARGQLASIPTGRTERETYRYRFGLGGTWDGRAGEKMRR